MTSLKKVYESLDKPPGLYFVQVQLPIILAGLMIFLFLDVFLGPMLTGLNNYIIYIIYAIPLYMLVASFFIPFAEVDSKKRKIDSYMNLFITRMGVLSTAELPRKTMLKILSQVKEYGLLTAEIRRIYILMEHWSQSLPEAAKFVSARTPSEILSDFLARMSHAVDTGEDFGKFIRKEQNVVMEEFAVKYTGAMKSLDILKEVYISIVSSAMFMLMFIVLLPMFSSGTNTLFSLIGMLFFFGTVEGVIAFYMKTKIPKDDIWHNMEIKHKVITDNNNIFTPFSVLLVFLIFIILMTLIKLPMQIAYGILFLPLIIPGYRVKKYEKVIKRSDNSFDAFIRALGASAEAMGGTVDVALKRLRMHDFGPLTEYVNKLYKRVYTRIDNLKAWKYFASDSGSNLISKFSEMYIKGTSMGGNPRIISEVISANYVRMLGLRKHRYQESSNLVGVLYGLSGAISFVLYLTLGIVRMMNKMFSSLNIGNTGISLPIGVSMVDTGMISWVVFMMILIHSYFSSLMMQTTEGSHKYIQMWHFPLLMLIGGIVGYISELGVSAMLNY